MLDNIEAVLFDLDGTLVDSMWLWKSVDIEYLARFGYEYEEDLNSAIEGMSFSETAIYFKNRYRIPDTLEKIKSDWNEMAYHKYMHEVPLKNGVFQFINKLKELGIKTGIATSNSAKLAMAVIESLSVKEYFDAVHTSCEVSKGKPAPDIYLYVAKQLNVTPERCLVFEDIIQGIMAGKNAGMRVCAVEDDNSKVQERQKRELADYYISDFYELI